MTTAPPPTGKRSPRWAFMARMVIPCENGENYLTRLRIIQTPWFGVYLHDLESNDSDPHPHDHPWTFWGFIVSSSCLEQVHNTPWVNLESVYLRKWNKWSWHKMPREFAHRIIEVDPGTKSLIFVGKRARNWGFFIDDGFAPLWMPWQDYEREYRSA